MAIVKTDIPMTSRLCNETIEAITAQYPFCRSEELTRSAAQRLLEESRAQAEQEVKQMMSQAEQQAAFSVSQPTPTTITDESSAAISSAAPKITNVTPVFLLVISNLVISAR